MELVPLALLGALVYKLVDFFKFVTNKNWVAARTQLIAWASGILAVTLFALSDFADGISMGNATLSSLSFPTLIIIGLSATSLFSAFYDLKSSLDNTDSAKTPALAVRPKRQLRAK